jgi:hypothetical protein
MRSSRQKLRLVHPGPKPRVTQSARRLGACLAESLRRVTVRSFASVAKENGGPYQIHNTLDCHCYDSNGKPLEAAAGKPSESKKPYKKFGAEKSMAFMQSMFEAYVKSQKKAGKSKKHKRRNNDSSDSSDSAGYGNTGFSVDKHLKTD